MATKLFHKQFNNSGPSLSSYKYLSAAASVLAFISSVTNKINGTTQCTDVAGGTVLKWTSPPLSAGVTISGTITYNAWVKTSSTTGAPKTVGRVFKLSGGVETQISTKTSTLVQSTSIQHDSFTDTAPTSTAFAIGDRIVVKWFVASTSATGTETIDYGGKTSAADGDTWVQFTETITFQKEPEFIQSVQNGGSGTPQTITFPGVCATGNTIVVASAGSPQAGGSVAISDSKSNVYATVEGPLTWGSTFNEQFDCAPNITGGAAIAVTATLGGTSPGCFMLALEYFGLDASAFDSSASFASGTGTTDTSNSLTPSNPYTLLLSIVDGNGSGSGLVPGTNFILRMQNSAGPGLQERYVQSATSYTASATDASQTSWVIGLAGFKNGFQPPNTYNVSVSLAGTAALTDSVTAKYPSSAALAGAAALTDSPANVIPASAAVGGAAAVATAGVTSIAGSASMAGAAGVAVSPSTGIPVSMSLAGAAALTDSPSTAIPVSAALAGSAALTDSAQVNFTGSASIAGAAAIANASSVSYVSSALLAGSADLADSATLAMPGAVSLAGTATLADSAAQGFSSSTALAGAADVAIVPSLGVPGAITLGGAADVATTGTTSGTVYNVSTTLAGSGSVAMVSSLNAGAAAAIAGVADLSDSAQSAIAAQSILAGAATLADSSQLAAKGAAALVSESGISTDSKQVFRSGAAMQGSADVETNAASSMAVVASLAGNALILIIGGKAFNLLASLDASAQLSNQAGIAFSDSAGLIGNADIVPSSSLDAVGAINLRGSVDMSLATTAIVFSLVSLGASAILNAEEIELVCYEIAAFPSLIPIMLETVAALEVFDEDTIADVVVGGGQDMGSPLVGYELNDVALNVFGLSKALQAQNETPDFLIDATGTVTITNKAGGIVAGPIPFAYVPGGIVMGNGGLSPGGNYSAQLPRNLTCGDNYVCKITLVSASTGLTFHAEPFLTVQVRR